MIFKHLFSLILNQDMRPYLYLKPLTDYCLNNDYFCQTEKKKKKKSM